MGMCGVLDPLPLPLVLAELFVACVCVCPLVATTPVPAAPPAPVADGGVVSDDAAACGSLLTVGAMAVPLADGSVAYGAAAVGVEDADEDEDAASDCD